MENQETNNYFILFPAYLLEELNPHECVLMGTLISLAKREGYAYPSNEMLARTLKTSVSTIGRMLGKLESDGYIKRDIIRDATNQVIARHIYILDSLIRGGIPKNDNRVSPEMETPLSSKMITPSNQNWADNKITINNQNRDSIGDIERAFESLWNRYLKRGNKKTSLMAFKRLSKSDMRAVWEHIPTYVDAHEKAGKTEFLPHLSTYINQKRWEDALPYQDAKQDLTKQLINWNE
jgi:hypothetical protein